MSNPVQNDLMLQFVYDLADVLREKVGFREPLASVIAQMQVDGLRERLGGQEVYISAMDKAARDTSIRETFNGRNIKEVYAKFGVSAATVYRVCSRRSSTGVCD